MNMEYSFRLQVFVEFFFQSFPQTLIILAHNSSSVSGGWGTLLGVLTFIACFLMTIKNGKLIFDYLQKIRKV